MNENNPKTREQMAQEIGISYSTFWRWLKKNDLSLPKGLIYPSDQKKIYQKLYSNSINMKEHERT